MTYFTFSLRQIRIVGRDEGRLTQYCPLAIQAADPEFSFRHTASTMSFGNRYHIVDDLFKPLQASPDEIEVVFELPLGFESEFIEYKRGARVEIRLGEDDAVPSDAPSPARTETASAPAPPSSAVTSAPRARRGGRVRGYKAKMRGSYFGDELPLGLSKYTEGINTEIRRGVISQGSVLASTSAQNKDAPAVLKRLKVPDDKRLLHLAVGSLRPRSLYGRALGAAVEVANNYVVIGDTGQVFKIIGKYALARVNSDELFELQYFPEAVGSIGGVGKFSRIQKRHLDGAELVFLFLIDPGVEIEHFKTGARANSADDLRGEGLIAPD